MESNRAAENLQAIRTLMERAALYRRALAPIMTFAGLVGMVATATGLFFRIETQTGFIAYWMGIAVAGVVGAFLLVRRQALKSAEPFWSPPTRRVAQALLPALTAGLLLGLFTYVVFAQTPVADPPTGTHDDAGDLFWLAAVWAVLYGCALHAAGFFTSRGLRLLGWLFIAAGFAVLFLPLIRNPKEFPDLLWTSSHWLMGCLFGLLQLAYGIYLFVTGEEQNEL
jgi:hypothetical protein